MVLIGTRYCFLAKEMHCIGFTWLDSIVSPNLHRDPNIRTAFFLVEGRYIKVLIYTFAVTIKLSIVSYHLILPFVFCWILFIFHHTWITVHSDCSVDSQWSHWHVHWIFCCKQVQADEGILVEEGKLPVLLELPLALIAKMRKTPHHLMTVGTGHTFDCRPK